MRTTDWLLLFALSVLWGLTYFFGVIATQSVPPLTLRSYATANGLRPRTRSTQSRLGTAAV